MGSITDNDIESQHSSQLFTEKKSKTMKSLFDPSEEKSACGVGFIVHSQGIASNDLLLKARQMSSRMEHRGACSCDNLTGDGAGVMTSIPFKLFEKKMREAGVSKIPAAGSYATGLVFLAESTALTAQSLFEECASKLGLKVIAWISPKVDPSILGSVALNSQPLIKQVFVVKDEELKEDLLDFVKNQGKEVGFEETVFFLRKWSTHLLVKEHQLRFYICSLSSSNFVFKGQFTPKQLWSYYEDLSDADFECFLALVHARFSTNTFPNWDRAQPLRLLAHNGEINTLRGNINSMSAREGIMKSNKFPKKDDLLRLFPVVEPDSSDSGSVDNVLEFLIRAGSDRSLPEAMISLVPEATDKNSHSLKDDFYRWSQLRMEAWDGPALFTFSDGRLVGAILDRNGLRPSRYVQTRDGLVIMASEVGVIDFIPEDDIKSSLDEEFEDVLQEALPSTEGIPVASINHLGRLRPGRILLVDTTRGLLIRDDQIKREIFESRVNNDDVIYSLDDLLEGTPSSHDEQTAPADDPRLSLFNYTTEVIEMLLKPMTSPEVQKEALGSMGNDSALAVLSNFQPLIYDYFKQVFAQVTNPPIDPFREKVVMSLACPVGPEGNLLDPKSVSKRLLLEQPILSNEEIKRVITGGSNGKTLGRTGWKSKVIDCIFTHDGDSSSPGSFLLNSLKKVCEEAVNAARNENIQIIILSDRASGSGKSIPIPALMSLGAVHHSLIQSRQRNKVALFVETGEAREVHHLCLLLGYGADAINPYMVFEVMNNIQVNGNTPQTVLSSYRKAVETGLLKVMAKMGISTLQSYKGAQIFEAVGLNNEVIDFCFKNTASRVGGVSFDELAVESIQRFCLAFKLNQDKLILRNPGLFHWRAGGESHVNEPNVVALLQEAAKNNSRDAYKKYVEFSRQSIRKTTLRGQLKIKYPSEGIPIESVIDSPLDIMRRFCTGAMSFGSISLEAHESLAIAMNQIGGKSNTGEGGESEERYQNPKTRSSIKQVASGRFGVTAAYLANADELQIKMAQGAKPGEGGELPGHKVTAEIAVTRKSVEGVGLISPPPHHDIYSIEDLAQLIYDLKCSNPNARISVKLVSVVGVGVVAAGVAKGKAEHITISGHDGGTGASSWTGIKGAGIPWELGLSETHQVLTANDLRSRVTLQVDGQLRSAFDVIVGAALGADEFAFSTAPLIVLGCTMMRKCHLNTCPVGVATQDPILRQKFTGQPDHVVTFFWLLAEEIREEMARLGCKTFDELIGRTDILSFDPFNEKAATLDFDAILCDSSKLLSGDNISSAVISKKIPQDFNLEQRIDNLLIKRAKQGNVLDKNNNDTNHLVIKLKIRNIDRCFGTTLSYACVKEFGENGLPENKSITIRLKGSAGQSFGAWICKGISLELEGEANDYVGKGLSGGNISVFPAKILTDRSYNNHLFKSENNIIVGNVCLYGATSGVAFFRGLSGERFAVRNSGAVAVVEGVGDHGCEYMTGGRVVILGDTGRNFGAGMSGGIAYVYVFPPYNLLRDRAENAEVKIEADRLEKMVQEKGLTEVIQSGDGQELIKNLEKKFKTDFMNKINPESIELFNLDDGGLICSHGDEKKIGVFEGEEQEVKKLLQDFIESTGSVVAKDILKNWTLSRKFMVKVFPKEFQRVLLEKKSNDLKLIQEVKQESKPAPKAVDIEDTIQDSLKKNLDKTRGFMKYNRIKGYYRNTNDRLKDWNEVYDVDKIRNEVKVQSARCMDCGIPFCQSSATGCPLGNMIPSFNDLVFKDDWSSAVKTLLQTNNFPEFTGRVCPAPCEGSCVLGINSDPVAIKSIEMSISEDMFQTGLVNQLLEEKHQNLKHTNFTVAIIGSGPAGLAAAAQCAVAGHSVTVFERESKPGGLLRFGIPNMKLDKKIVDRRIELMTKTQGIKFVCGVDVGNDSSVDLTSFNAIGICVGATWPRNLSIKGREAEGIYFAMDYLGDQDNKRQTNRINAKDKKVIVVGGGDTGCDCIGTSVREGATSVVAFEILPMPPNSRAEDNPWPQWPKIFRVDYGHEEVKVRSGNDPRLFEMSAKEFVTEDVDGKSIVKGIRAVKVSWTKDDNGRWSMKEVPGTETVFEADLVLLAMGFLGPEKYLASSLNLKIDERSNNFVTQKTPEPFLDESSSIYFAGNNVFVSGDCRRGQSLVVHAINEGRQMARAIDLFYKNQTKKDTSSSELPASGGIILPSSSPFKKRPKRQQQVVDVKA